MYGFAGSSGNQSTRYGSEGVPLPGYGGVAATRSSGSAERESDVVGELGEDEFGLGVGVPRGQGFSRGVDNAEVGLEEEETPISSVDVDDREEDRLPDIDIVRAISQLEINQSER